MGTGNSGKDVTVSFAYNGSPQDIFDDVVGHEVEPILTDSSTQVLGQDGLKTEHDRCGLFRVGARANPKITVGSGQTKVAEECLGDAGVIVLASVNQELMDRRPLHHSLPNGRQLHKVGPGTIHVQEFQSIFLRCPAG